MESYRAIKEHFINSLIWRGRKVAAEYFLTNTLMRLKKLNEVAPFDVFYYSSLNLRPLVFLRPVRVGSVIYRVPGPISGHRQRLYAIKFILQAIKDSRDSITVERLALLLTSIYRASKNVAVEKKMAIYREAADNRSFIRYLKRKL